MNQKIEPADGFHGQLQLPADKSISHRSALFASLHNGKSVIQNFSKAADPHSTLSCLTQLGVRIDKSEDQVIVHGVGRQGFQNPDSPLDCGNSGTTMRLLSGIVGGAGVTCTLVGDESLSARTMKRIIDPLKTMGIDIDARDNDFAPLKISRSGPVHPIRFPLPIASAQLKSCVLLAGLFGETDTVVVETKTSRDHTERLLQMPIENSIEEKIIKSNSQLAIPEQSCTIPGDFSAASFWLVGASIHPEASIELNSVGVNPTRTGALNILQEMGANIQLSNRRMEGAEPIADIKVTCTKLKPINIKESMVPNCIDEIPVLLVAMLFADGTSSVRGAGELRHKETDRLSAMAQVLETAGASFKELDDGFIVHGDPKFVPKHGYYKSEDDHRIAMAAAILASVADGKSTLEGAESTKISYPLFWDHFAGLTN